MKDPFRGGKVRLNWVGRLAQFFTLLALLTACSEAKYPSESAILGSVTHHDTPIPHAEVYIAADQHHFPGHDHHLYEMHTHADENGVFQINLEEPGQYYIYSEGYDAGIRDSVFGGIPFEIEEKHGAFHLIVPVTE